MGVVAAVVVKSERHFSVYLSICNDNAVPRTDLLSICMTSCIISDFHQLKNLLYLCQTKDLK